MDRRRNGTAHAQQVVTLIKESKHRTGWNHIVRRFWIPTSQTSHAMESKWIAIPQTVTIPPCAEFQPAEQLFMAVLISGKLSGRAGDQVQQVAAYKERQ